MSDDNVIPLDVETTNDLNPNDVLDAVKDADPVEVIIIADYGEHDSMALSSSTADVAYVLLQLELARDLLIRNARKARKHTDGEREEGTDGPGPAVG